MLSKKQTRQPAQRLITLFTFLPNILLRPVGGVLADRFDRRTMMIIGDLGSAAGLVFILSIMLAGDIQLWHIYVGVAFSSVFTAPQSPAYKASATDLLDKDQFSKADGLVRLAESSKFLFSPIIAGILLSVTTIEVIMIINIATFLIAILAVLVIRKSMKVERENKENHSWLSDIQEGWREVVTNKGVSRLSLLFLSSPSISGFWRRLLVQCRCRLPTPKRWGLFSPLVPSEC